MSVCAECFDDQDLRTFVRTHLSETCCDYCGKDSEEDCPDDENPELIACDDDEVFQYIQERIEANYSTNDQECIPYDEEDGCYFLPVWSTYELFNDELGGFPTRDEDLITNLVNYLPDVEWCERDPQILSPLEGLQFGWKEFCNTIKHQTRFLFFAPGSRRAPDELGYEPNAVEPSEMLSQISDLIRDYKLVRDVPADSIYYRVRCAASSSYESPGDLGPPPAVLASGGRMNPVGIAMTYVAEETETALAESVTPTSHLASIGKWQTIRSLRVLDLVALPEPIGFFSEMSGTHDAEMIAFLREFRRTIMEPVHQSSLSKEPLEYVPSQVVTEYLRLRFNDSKGQIQGIRYPSVKRRGGVNLVLFFGQDSIEGIESSRLFKPVPQLRLVGVTHQPIGTDSSSS